MLPPHGAPELQELKLSRAVGRGLRSDHHTAHTLGAPNSMVQGREDGKTSRAGLIFSCLIQVISYRSAVCLTLLHALPDAKRRPPTPSRRKSPCGAGEHCRVSVLPGRIAFRIRNAHDAQLPTCRLQDAGLAAMSHARSVTPAPRVKRKMRCEPVDRCCLSPVAVAPLLSSLSLALRRRWSGGGSCARSSVAAARRAACVVALKRMSMQKQQLFVSSEPRLVVP